MKKAILSLLLQLFCAAGFSQNLPLKPFGEPFRRADLDVIWNAPTNALPAAYWVYRVRSATFSPALISYLMALGSLTENDRTNLTKSPLQDTNAVLFLSPDQSRMLWLYPPQGALEYDSQRLTPYGPTHLAEGVPPESQLFQLTTNFLPRLGINVSELSGKDRSTEPRFHFFASQVMYFVNHSFITNVESRGVRFRRLVDGMEFNGDGGNCEIDFGEHGKVVKLSLSWRELEHYRRYAAAPLATVTKWIRDGRGVVFKLSDGILDWPAVKRVTVTEVTPVWLGEQQAESQEFVHPLVRLTANIDTGEAKIAAIIWCPIIDESRPLKGK